MDLHKGTVVYFSPTGGTKKAIMCILDGLKIEMDEFDITGMAQGTSGREFGGDELAVIGVPSYGGRVPKPAVEKLRLLKGNRTPAVLVAVYGNRASEDTLAELRELLSEQGFICVAAVEAIAEHSIMRHFAEGRPDENDHRILKDYGKIIAQRILSAADDKQLKHADIPGDRPWRQYNGIPLKPKASEQCMGCGRCVNHCPVGAISPEHPDRTDTGRCISCMGCIAVCPAHARKLNSVLLKIAEETNKGKFKSRRENKLY